MLARSARLCEHLAELMALSHPLSVQFTPEQLAWLDSHRPSGLSRSAALRLVVQHAIDGKLQLQPARISQSEAAIR